MRLLKRIVRAVTAAGMLSALVIPAACGDATGPSPFLSLAHGRAQSLWANRKPASYSIVVGRSCECQEGAYGQVTVTVVDGVIVSRRFGSGEEVPEQFASLYPDVDGLFDLIDLFVHEDVDGLAVEYDRERGYPIRIRVDRYREYVDDEVSYTTRDFQPQ